MGRLDVNIQLQEKDYLGTDNLTCRGEGVMVFFLKNILIPNVAEKNILVEEKKYSDSEFFSYSLMLNSGNTFFGGGKNK